MDSEEVRPHPAAASKAIHFEASAESFSASRDKSLLQLGAVLGLLGLVMQIVMDRLHPHRIAPNDSVNVSGSMRDRTSGRLCTLVSLWARSSSPCLCCAGEIAVSATWARRRPGYCGDCHGDRGGGSVSSPDGG